MGVTSILSLLSGVALFLYGMSVMGDSLKKVAGNKLELILYKLTSTPLKGILLGTAVTAIIQSSSGDNSYGCRIRKFWYDEGCAVNWYYHGRKYRNECHWLDPLSVLY